MADSSEPLDEEEGKVLTSLAEVVADYWQEPTDPNADAFENYVRHCHAKICTDRQAFAGRLKRGYRRLIQELHETKGT